MIIKCSNLTKSYLVEDETFKAVDSVSFSVKQGDFVIILGHSGSGKTTLLSLIGGLTKPDNGEVFIHDTSIWHKSDNDISVLRNKTIGFVFQFASLIPNLNVIENMLLPLSFGKKIQTDIDLAYTLLDKIGLADKHKSFPAQLSGGQQRRVAIARAFINKPEIILADEPTGDLDEETESIILDLFRDYNKQGVTFMVVTHNTDLCNSQDNPRIFSMQNGLLSDE